MKKFELKDLLENKPFLSLLLSFIPFAGVIQFMPLAYGKTTIELFLFGSKLKEYQSSGTTAIFEMFPIGFYFTLLVLVLGLFLKKRVWILINIVSFTTLGNLFYNLWASDLLFVMEGILLAVLGLFFLLVWLIVWTNTSSSNDSLDSE